MASSKMFTSISALGLSHPFTVCVTYHDVVPTTAVEGTGAVGAPVPPVGAVYQRRLAPDATRAIEIAFLQYVTGVVTEGANGIGFTVTVAVVELTQPKTSVPTIVYVVVTVGVAVTMLPTPELNEPAGLQA